MKKNAVVLAGFYGYGNAGDELILGSLIGQLRRENSSILITVMSRRPRETERRFGVKAISRWLPWMWILPLVLARRFILGGGGLLQESTGPWNHAYYLGLVVLAKLFGCRTDVRAIGVDPIQSDFNRAWTRFVLNWAADAISVRDVESVHALKVAGVFKTVRQTIDPVLQLEAPPDRIPEEWKIALAVSPWKERSTWASDVAALTDRIRERLGVNTDLIVFFPVQDRMLSDTISRLSRQPLEVREWKEPEDLLTWIPTYGLVIGMRYHALALAAVSQRSFIGWGFQRKVRSLCQAFSQPVWPFERGWDSEAVFRQIEQAWGRRGRAPKLYSSYV